MDVIELNEVFISQVIECDRELRFNSSKLNVNDRAIAHGYQPVSTEAISTTKEICELHRTKKYALITACKVGRQGIVRIIERNNCIINSIKNITRFIEELDEC